MSRAEKLRDILSRWAKIRTKEEVDAVREELRGLWPRLNLRLTTGGGQIFVQDNQGAAFVEIYTKPYRSREWSPQLIGKALVILDALDDAHRLAMPSTPVELMQGDEVISQFADRAEAERYLRWNPMVIIEEARGRSLEEFMADAGLSIRPVRADV